jgi:hypothetical protein
LARGEGSEGLNFVFNGNASGINTATNILKHKHCIMMIYPGCSDMENAKIKDIEFSKMKKNVFKTFENIKTETGVENDKIMLIGFSIGNLFVKHILDNSETKIQEVKFDSIPTKAKLPLMLHNNIDPLNVNAVIPFSRTLTEAFVTTHEKRLPKGKIPEEVSLFGYLGDQVTPIKHSEAFLDRITNKGQHITRTGNFCDHYSPKNGLHHAPYVSSDYLDKSPTRKGGNGKGA